MIFNMHISDRYSEWGVNTPRVRERTLCGKLTAPKFTGVPTITKNQPAGEWNGGRDFGWCIACCMAFLRETEAYNSIENRHLYRLYFDARNLAQRQLAYAIKPEYNGSTSLK